MAVDNSPPLVTDLSASQLIPDDTDGVPLWGETATLTVTVTDESDIASVTTDLSAIGGSPVQPMTNLWGNVWSVATNASAGTLPWTYALNVCATDIHGYTNMSESIQLVVMRNGDVTGDGDVTPADVILLDILRTATNPSFFAMASRMAWIILSIRKQTPSFHIPFCSVYTPHKKVFTLAIYYLLEA